MTNKCLYRCWTHSGQKMQSCLPHNGILDGGEVTMQAPLTGATITVIPDVQKMDCGEKVGKYQVIKCKYPGCL